VPGEYLTLGKMFYNLLLKQEAVAAPQLLTHFLPYRIPPGGLD
jgi:hypothetical protein